MEIKDMLTKDV